LAATVCLFSRSQHTFGTAGVLAETFSDVFEENSGIKANVVYLKKGSLERLKQQPGSVDAILTVDIANLSAISAAGLFQPLQSKIIEQNVPANYRDPDGLWTALTARARVIYYSKDRVKTADLATYENLADPEFKGRLCTRSGYHKYNVALISSMIAEHGTSAAKKVVAKFKKQPCSKTTGK